MLQKNDRLKLKLNTDKKALDKTLENGIIIKNKLFSTKIYCFNGQIRQEIKK